MIAACTRVGPVLSLSLVACTQRSGARQVRHQVSQIDDREAWAPDHDAAQPVPCQRSSFVPSPIHDSDPAGASIAKSHGRLG
jgi:hypothetical protein